MKPLDRAVWWTEYVLRHRGASHLRSPTANISWTDFLELELLFTVLIFISVIVIGIGILIHCVIQIFLTIIKSDKSKSKSS